MAKKTFQYIKGMPDLLPEQTGTWQFLEKNIQQLLASYGYREIRLPVVEYTDLFKRSIGEVTDIVEKEMYTFADRHGDLVTLRPEGTAGCVRACIQHGLVDNQAQQRLWYQGPMFRYENTQKGRQRQFHQLGVETFNIASVDIEIELMNISFKLWQKLGIANKTGLQINTIGSMEDRQQFRASLLDYLEGHKENLDKDSQRRLETNPLRILDSKAPETQEILENAPQLEEFLNQESQDRFKRLCGLLDELSIPYTINQRLVRGLDYYNDTVFEWVTDILGAQGTICAGGRYDGLVEQLGGKSVPAFGFAIGLERLALMLDAIGQEADSSQQVDVYFVVAGDESVYSQSLQYAEQIRQAIPELKMIFHAGGGSFKSQMKKADKSGAAFALICGSDEIENGVISLKPMRQEYGAEQLSLPVNDLIEKIRFLLAN